MGREKPEESERMFRGYFALPLVGNAVISPEKTWLEVNDRFCDLIGYSREELARLTCANITHPDDLQATLDIFDILLRGEQDRCLVEKRFLHKNGRVVDAELSLGCIRNPNGNVECFVAIVHDIRQRKENEREREKLHRMKMEFLTTVAHELRTPLTSIRGYSELLLNRENLTEEKQKYYAACINKESETLAGVIDKFLNS
jgi:PAS domain S-box-containing protein